MALNAGKKVQERAGHQFGVPLAAGATVYQGGMVARSAGLGRAAAPAASAGVAAATAIVGIAERTVTNTGADQAVNVPTKSGVFLFKNSAGGDAITEAAIGQPAFVVDDETVALTNTSNLRPRAGTIVDVESDGVWVRIGV